MAAEPLGPPPAELSTEKFAKKYLDPAHLVRISSYITGEPYFGKSGNNRFDAPGASTAVFRKALQRFAIDLM